MEKNKYVNYSLFSDTEHSAMAKIYADLVRRGQRTIEEVPERWRAEVEEILRED